MSKKSQTTTTMTSESQYDVSRTLPVARFFYQGHHSHPVRRTVLVIESGKNLIRGYELREGTTTRNFSGAPVKSYRKDMIAAGDNLRTKNKEKTTLKRLPLFDLIENGI